MSKPTKRKITVELPKSKELSGRPSVFERLGTKKASSKKSEHCRQWAQNGSCAYGKSCKFASTHTLVSPSKRAANKDSEQKRLLKDDPKSRLHSTVVVRSGEIDNWDQNDLEYADTDVLEKRRQELQRELDLQLKMDSGKKKKITSSSSSSRSSSTSSVSSSSSGGSSSSSSSERNARRKGKKGKVKRNCSSSSDGDIPTKKKYTKVDSSKRDKSENKKVIAKKDDRLTKRNPIIKKKPTKTTLGRKSLSPGRKTGGTPPIQLKALSKVYSSRHGKSPYRRDKNKSVSPSPNKDREKDRGKDRDKERDRDRDRERNKGKSRSQPRSRARSRSLPRYRSISKDARRKDSSPKKQVKRDASSDRHRKTSKDRDKSRDHKDKSLERRKDKHDDKERDRKDKLQRSRDRTKDVKRDDSSKRGKGGRDRGSGRSGKDTDKGLAKPNKPMERLLPRPEERLAAIAAITNKVLEVDKASTTSKDRPDSERGNRKQDRERGIKRVDRSLDRETGDYDADRQYDRSRPLDEYDRADDGYSDGPREDARSPGYGRDRRYEPGYDLPGPQRGYPEGDDRMYMGDHRGYDERRRDHSWEGRPGSMDRERPFMHPRKDWEGEDFRPAGDWGRERHWPMHEPPIGDWGDKDPGVDGWHHRGPGPHGRRNHDDYGRNVRKDRVDKRRPPQRAETSETAGEAPATVSAPTVRTEDDDKPIPDDLSEISDDPDDILNREDMTEPAVDEDSQTSQVAAAENTSFKPDTSENQSTQDTSGVGDDKESQEGKDDEVVSNLDFEEISDGELEEERTRAGLGDALGVDWASLVADVQRRENVEAPKGSALSRWNPQRVLAKVGLSIEMAGKDTVQAILDANTEQERESKGDNENEEETVQSVKVEDLHPVAAIQVAIKKRALERAALFGSGCEIRRALNGRRDLAVRRHLCRLPVAERLAPPRHSPQRALYHAAKALLMQQPLPA